MKFELERSIEQLSSTPDTLRAWLGELSDEWTRSSGSVNEWGPFDVVGHLIYAEEADWIPRARIILAQNAEHVFEPFDRLAQFERSKGKSLNQLLEEFSLLRTESVRTLRSWELVDAELELKGTHPELGEVTLKQLLATWVVHDLTHIRQIAASMAMKYEKEVGPWRAYLSILNK